ncbi:MAG: glycosyltransferase family 2 protein [Bacteroides sp.]|nr:glycosyltransferase family 2 protein [Bacteroides sp.]
MKISIVILNYNSWSMANNAIDSILNSQTSHSVSIVTVDNNSTIAPDEVILRDIKRKSTAYIESKSNRGYSSGNNIGIKFSLEQGCDLLIIANPDVTFDPSAIAELAAFLEENPKYGIAGPTIVNSSGSMQPIVMGEEISLSRKYMALLNKASCGVLFKRFSKKNYRKDVCVNDSFDVYIPSGCCLAIHRRAFEWVFPLDENVFLYLEEYIIAKKLAPSRLRSRVVGSAHLTHQWGYSTKGIGLKALGSLAFSEFYYFRKYHNKNIIELLPLLILRVCQMFRRQKQEGRDLSEIRGLARRVYLSIRTKNDGYFLTK